MKKPKEECSIIYTLILGVCMLLCLLMIGKMLLHDEPTEPQVDPQPEPSEMQQEQPLEEEGELALQLTENDLCTVIVQSIPFTVNGITAQIEKDGNFEVTAEVSRQALLDSKLAAGTLRTALLFLPEQCKVYGAFQITAVQGQVSLKCTKAEIAGYALPDTARDMLTQALAAGINQQLTEWGIKLRNLQCEDGILSLYA